MKYPDFIEQLILEKSYAQLSAEEKAQVAEWVATEAEYTNIRSLLTTLEGAVESAMGNPVPDRVKQQLTQAFEQKHNKQSQKGLIIFKKYAVPLSIAASLLIIATVAGVLFTSAPPTVVVENKTTPTPSTETPVTPPTVNESPIQKIEKVTPTNTIPDNTETPHTVKHTPEPQSQTVTAANNPDLVNMTVIVF
ncbi:hypothetical protein QQ054_28325 [Oscillatoria amoena NRMC-F 0135]|nr:hypothetical protein [Oscillatoria amoena NRMC-F 0135]